MHSLNKLSKFLHLEVERGYDNRAIVGGLDKALAAWENDALSDNLDTELISKIRSGLLNYPTSDIETRRKIIQDLQQVILEQTKDEEIRTENPATPAIKQPVPKAPPPPSVESHAPARNQQSSKPAFRSSTPAPVTTQRKEGHPTPQGPAALNAPLTVLSGIGAQHAKTLAQVGLHSLGDLLYYFPRRYDDYSQLKMINRLWYGEEVTIIGEVKSINTRELRGGQFKITEAVISDGSGNLRLTWFNQPWIGKQIRPDAQIVISGRVDQYLGRLVINNPEWEPIDQEQLHTNRIVPVYRLTGHVTQRFLRRQMHQVITFWAPRVQDHLPSSIKKNAQIIDLSQAILQVHFPDSVEKLQIARNRLAFDEIFLLQLGVLNQKRNWQSATAQKFETDPAWLSEQINRLPYQLTNAQLQALEDLRGDLVTGHPMNRLLQGDVGSGKTIVAALTATMITQHGAQVAVMAPTSILAEQHYRNFTNLLTGADDESTAPLKKEQIRLLIGDTPESEKSQIRDGLENGDIKIVIGTHALIEDPIIFKDLQFAVIDEQHRFGVSQRAALRAKGNNPHLLVMTATPIPRSLALTLYGDLDISILNEMPPGRQVIDTHIFYPQELERAYTFIQKQVDQGHQVYIIYPLIEENEDDETLAAVEEHERLQQEVFPHLSIGLLHGRLKPAQKEEVMARFRDGEHQILVSTTVVEVGVDVPNATVMMIRGANRFGLAQLHQLRGRVGRGDAQSYCLLVPDTEDAAENERLTIMSQTNDGFVLAEKDLEQRGPGEFLGTRQAGFSELKMASITDIQLIEVARREAKGLFESDPDLVVEEHKLLASALKQFWNRGQGDIS